jgi:hypothetical protein
MTFRTWLENFMKDSGGETLPLYHGTTGSFGDFDSGKIDEPHNYRGFYFTPSKQYARCYAINGPAGSKGRLKCVNLRIQNPFYPLKYADDKFINDTIEKLIPDDMKKNARLVAAAFRRSRYKFRDQWLNYLQVSPVGERLGLGRDLRDLELLKRLGYDGIVKGVPTWGAEYNNSSEDAEEIIAFYPDQVVPKSEDEIELK